MVTKDDTTDLKAPHLPPAENAMSRRYLCMLEKWVPVGCEYFAEWPDRPRCGHFFGGVHWYGNETVGPAMAFALASISPECDEAAAGVSRDELRRMAIEAVRYLCFTHDTGPEGCVRPSEGLGRPENCGTKWGERGTGFFKESQCGSGIAAIARICLLLRDHIDDETWMMVARIHEDYAERFGDMPPKSGVYLDTQMEENAWTSTGLASCLLFLSRHEKAETWEAMARRWMFSTCAAPQDAKDCGEIGSGTAAALAGKIFTALPDYWAENHGMVHPNYTASGVRSLLSVGCQLELWGRELPPELFWNRRRVYENLKALTDGAGYAQAVQGMDWHYLPTVGSETPHAIAAVFFDDPDAAALQQRGLRRGLPCRRQLREHIASLHLPALPSRSDPPLQRFNTRGGRRHALLLAPSPQTQRSTPPCASRRLRRRRRSRQRHPGWRNVRGQHRAETSTGPLCPRQRRRQDRGDRAGTDQGDLTTSVELAVAA